MEHGLAEMPGHALAIEMRAGGERGRHLIEQRGFAGLASSTSASAAARPSAKPAACAAATGSTNGVRLPARTSASNGSQPSVGFTPGSAGEK
jgi:hypothetical protein